MCPLWMRNVFLSDFIYINNLLFITQYAHLGTLAYMVFYMKIGIYVLVKIKCSNWKESDGCQNAYNPIY